MRCEILYTGIGLDGRAKKITDDINPQVHHKISALSVLDVYLFSLDRDELEPVMPFLYDPVSQTIRVDSFYAEEQAGWDCLIEVTYKPGVTDPVFFTLKKVKDTLLGAEKEVLIRTARQYLFSLAEAEKGDIEKIQSFLYNPLIQDAVVLTREDWLQGKRPPVFYPGVSRIKTGTVETFSLHRMTDDELVKLSKQRLLALSLEEMRALRSHFSGEETRQKRRQQGLPPEITDVELEMIAQTWSEHCKHKILNARIDYTENGKTERLESLFSTYIAGTTKALEKEKPFLKSVFHDNSGVIALDEDTCVCFKVETHNSPSALDPYGGAITGIVGVNRDILGTGKGARPIFNTDVLCFGLPDTSEEELPAGLLHPSRVLSGVHRGIVDGGNQSGIPVVGGAFLFDESYLGKPLVFCGTGGLLPAEIHGEAGWIKHIDPGDLAVMVGGRIGKDGIHGATFSSLELSESSPTSAVQIGDPITQKKMADFLLEARDAGLYKGITDNGAGGLSSSLGEMAEDSGGVIIDLDECPLKYSGLAPWEILVSESQERMSLAVDPANIEEFLRLAARRDVEATVVGTFTDSGYVEIRSASAVVGSLSLDFLHHGLPVMELEARWAPPSRPKPLKPPALPDREMILSVLADPNVCSKESLIRQYDHEVQGRSVQKPFVGEQSDGPSDGGVLKISARSPRGLTVTCGICPRYGDLDTYHMAACAVDEAYRAHIALGGRSDMAAALDNFCWPDPVASEQVPDGHYKLAQLVRACRGLQDACLAYRLPLISGKDSMKNDATLGDRRISVRPTLLISLLGIVEDVEKTLSSDFKEAGDLVYLLGYSRGELGGSTLERVTGLVMPGCPEVHFDEALRLYRALEGCIGAGIIRSCHDLSDGGLAAAAAESCLGGRLGADLDLSAVPLPDGLKETASERLFCESPSRFLVSVPPEKAEELEKRLAGSAFGCLGRVTETRTLKILLDSRRSVALPLKALEQAWKGTFGGMRE